MKRIIPLLLIVPFILTDCAFWKSTTLSAKRYAFVRSGSKPGQVMIKTDEYGLEDLTIGVSVSKKKICIADNELHRVQVIKPDGDIELMVGSLKNVKTGDIPSENFNFGTIGYIIMDDDDNVYIQNKFSKIREGGRDKDSGSDSIDVSPSYIVKFNKSGELQYTLGQKGAPDTPFSHIERLYVDSNDRLFVISRSMDSWSVFRFNGKNRDYYVNLGTLNLQEREEGNVYEGKIDNVRIFSSGDKLLISVSYYHGLRLKYIKIFEFPIQEGKIAKNIMTIPDPKNVLFDIIDDKYIYLWNVNNDQVKFEVANLDGTIVNNVYLNIENKRNYYSRIILDDAGRIYSYNILRSGVDILKWE
ncbi:MAG TPA: hypothetical protein PKX40_20620 [Spirochaetota bacterium]|nr:hypothetical protein [Spirochaetota bacterium]